MYNKCMNILVTGGAGYIGSHTLIELIAASHDIQVADNLTNGSSESVKRVEEITGATIPVHDFDLLDKPRLSQLFDEHRFDAVIHFAGLKAVGESVRHPLAYYRVNLDIALNLLEVMDAHDVRKLVFSSSATVYGSAPVPYREDGPAGHDLTNPYGKTKYIIEEILHDTAAANPENQFSILRYFNPIGAHPSGKIGERPQGTPNNIMPYITQVAAGERDKLSVFGNNYPTPDGTCLRDYVHVVDLAKGHVAALEHLQPGTNTYNFGSGKGVSVLELIHAFEKATGAKVPYEIATRRAGDLAVTYADVSKAQNELGWKAEKTLEEACADSWRWQTQNPHGYEN